MKQTRATFVLSVVALAAVLGARSPRAGDWPQWRGPDRTGISQEKGWNPGALEGGAKVVWRASIGTGYASMAIAGGKVYTAGNSNNEDRVVCLDAATGRQLWSQGAPARSGGGHAGSRATPTAEAGRVYMLNRDGLVLCLDAADGKVVWRRNLVKDNGMKNLGWGFSASPLVLGERVILNAGDRGVALNKSNGEVVWSTGPGPAGYASPVVCTLGGQPGLLIFGQNKLFGVDAAAGKELWSFEWKTSWDVNAPDPIPVGNKVFITSGYGRGCAVIDVAATPPVAVWQNKLISSQFASAVLIDGCIYGCDGNTGTGRLRCVEFVSGKERWSEEVGFASLIAVDSKLLVLNESGMLTVANAAPEGFVRLSAAKVLDGKICWTAPAFSGGRVYARSHPGDLVCVDLAR